MSTPRGIRNNNPGNLDKGSPWQGLVNNPGTGAIGFPKGAPSDEGGRGIWTGLKTRDFSPAGFEYTSSQLPVGRHRTSQQSNCATKVQVCYRRLVDRYIHSLAACW